MNILGISRLSARVLRRLSTERAQRQLAADFGHLVATRSDAYRPAALNAAGPTVAFATFGCGHWHFVLESLLAHALALRGARPEMLVCDMPTLPICHERNAHSRHQTRCDGCLESKRPLLDACGIPWQGITNFVRSDALARAHAIVDGIADDEIDNYQEAGWPVGKWLYVSSCHFLRADGRGDEPQKVDIRRRLLTSAIVIVDVVTRWLDAVQPDVVVAQSGAHFMWRIVLELAQARGIPVICREMGKGGWDRHIYALDADCMAPNLGSAWDVARKEPLSASERETVESYLKALPAKTYVQKYGGRHQHTRTGDLKQTLGIPHESKLAVLFTNVTWDLATAGRDVAFDGVFDWVQATIRTIGRVRDAHLAIRAHPAEASVMTRERILDRITQIWPAGSPHVTLIPPERELPVGDLCKIADLVLVYCSTAGIEAAAYGAPVLLCGAPHFRSKGFTIDISSRDAYAAEIEAWAAGKVISAPADAIELARRYAHLFFLRYHVPMGWTTSELKPTYRLTIRSLTELQSGSNPALDIVCSGILQGRQILLPRQSTIV